ncbi:hypothetical protein BJV77DRAFT_1069162 [Russula vinacea]|nr:hypothetical protein BJV77DRAFT_1069162 [Russula vinacea]
MYATEGNFNFNGTFTDVKDPKDLFIKSAKLIITTLQGGRFAPATPTPDLLSTADWAELSCALLAAIGRGYSLMFDKERADTLIRKDWGEAPDPKPLSPRYPTLFHRLSATADSLNDQLVFDGQDDACDLEGWIMEAKVGIHREETKNIKAQIEEDWRQWRTDQFTIKAAAQEKEIEDAVRAKNTSYFLKAAAELGLRLAPPPPPPKPSKGQVVGHQEVGNVRSQVQPPAPNRQHRGSKRLTHRGPQPKEGGPLRPPSGAQPEPKGHFEPGPEATIQAAVGPAIQTAMATLTARLTALERSAMPPPLARRAPRPNPGEQPDQRGTTAPQNDYPTPANHAEGDFTLVTHNGKGRKGRGKTNATGAQLEQPRQTNPTPASYAGIATAASNLPQPPTQRKSGNPPPTITEVTVLRAGGLLDAQQETQLRNRAADAIVREVRLKMAKAMANPIRLRAGRWSINPRSRGNFVFSFDGNVPFDVIKSYEHLLLSPLGGTGELCPSMGWTRFLANGVPAWDDDDLPFNPSALLEEVRTLPGLKKVFFAMQPRWLTHTDRIHTPYSSVTFAISDPDGSISTTLTSNRAALFGKEVTIRKWIDKPAFIQWAEDWEAGRRDLEEEWDDEAPGHPLNNLPSSTPTRAPTAPMPQTHEPSGTQAPLPTPTPAHVSPTGTHTMNVDYDYVDPLTNRPDSQIDLPTGGDMEPLLLQAPYSPSCPQAGINPPTHD